METKGFNHFSLLLRDIGDDASQDTDDKLSPHELKDLSRKLIAQCVNQKDEKGFTLLDHAIHNAYLQMVRLLLVSGAKVSVEHFHLALDHSKSCQEVVDAGMEQLMISIARGVPEDETKEDLYDRAVNAYQAAVERLPVMNDIADLMILLSDSTRKSGFTLHSAAAKGAADELVYLIRQGAPIDEKDADGNMAIHLAVQNEHEEIVRLLLTAGANQKVRNADDSTPYLLASDLLSIGPSDGSILHSIISLLQIHMLRDKNQLNPQVPEKLREIYEQKLKEANANIKARKKKGLSNLRFLKKKHGGEKKK